MKRNYDSQSKILSSLGVFSALALLHSGQRSVAAPPSIQLSQDEKSIPNPIIFHTENRNTVKMAGKLTAVLALALVLALGLFVSDALADNRWRSDDD